MSPSDLARLEIAKRAYQATQPRAAEVQTGVRRARLWLGRARPRRNWFSKGLVLVVLALGSLAYAKPQALGELVQSAIRPNPPLPTKRSGHGAPALRLADNEPPAAVAKPVAIVAEPVALTAQPGSALARPSAFVAEAAATDRPAGTKAARRATARTVTEAGDPELEAGASARAGTSSNWGSVGRALAQGDDSRALSALEQLSASDDTSTRDKADLGRAQLLMAHGSTEQACALARALLERQPGARIARQARGLLKTCVRR